MSYKFFQNKECEYFPCHKVDTPENFNCLFCYCPLYHLGDKCCGNPKFLDNKIKDCSNCYDNNMTPQEKNFGRLPISVPEVSY